jgi:hypothetical protein
MEPDPFTLKKIIKYFESGLKPTKATLSQIPFFVFYLKIKHYTNKQEPIVQIPTGFFLPDLFMMADPIWTLK